MGFIRTIGENWRKAEAAAIVQNIIEQNAKLLETPVDAATLANRMVGEVWDDATPLFDGSRGAKPHKATLAAAALAHALENRRLPFEIEFAAINGIAAILRAVGKGSNASELSKADHVILNACAATMVTFIEEQGISADEPAEA
jgi:hypothetical protein